MMRWRHAIKIAVIMALLNQTSELLRAALRDLWLETTTTVAIEFGLDTGVGKGTELGVAQVSREARFDILAMLGGEVQAATGSH